jgi:hypothetical protein
VTGYVLDGPSSLLSPGNKADYSPPSSAEVKITASESLQPANLNVRDFIEHTGIDGKIILKFVFTDNSVGVRDGIS